MASISVIIPTYKREAVLVETLQQLSMLLKPGDEILVIDQTLDHEPATIAALERLAGEGAIRWYRRSRPSQNEAMNIAAQLAQGEILLFLDDDIVPFDNLLEGHRQVLSQADAPAATCGHVLQPWDKAPVDSVKDFDMQFNAAYSKPCEIRFLMAGNFAMRRETYLAIGGMDENFRAPIIGMTARWLTGFARPPAVASVLFPKLGFGTSCRVAVTVRLERKTHGDTSVDQSATITSP